MMRRFKGLKVSVHNVCNLGFKDSESFSQKGISPTSNINNIITKPSSSNTLQMSNFKISSAAQQIWRLIKIWKDAGYGPNIRKDSQTGLPGSSCTNSFN